MLTKNKKAAIDLGSSTAKGGFKNEDEVIKKFNNWKLNSDAQNWLIIMGYKISNIKNVNAIKVHGYKTDVQVQVKIETIEAISVENLSLKLVSNSQGYNQVDKRWLNKYKELWSIPEDVLNALKLFTGEIKPTRKNVRDNRRMFLDEMDFNIQNVLINFFSDNKIKIVTDILMGRGQYAARWMLVILKYNNTSTWVLKTINEAMNVFGGGKVYITSKGNLKIGEITLQRKGGDGGRSTANMLQFKINPCLLFNKE